MPIPRRIMMAGLFVWTAGLAFTPLLDWRSPDSGFVTRPNRGKLTVVYVGADDCAPCIRWRRERRPDFQRSVAFQRIEYREIIAPKLLSALEDQYWPEPMRSMRSLIVKAGGGVPHWFLLRNGRVIMSAGGDSAWDRQVWPTIVMES